MEKMKLITKIVDEYYDGKQDYYHVEIFKTEKNNSESYNAKVIEKYTDKIYMFNIWMKYEPYTNQYRFVIKMIKNNKLAIEEYNVPAETNSDQTKIIKRIANFIFNENLLFINKESAYQIAEDLVYNRDYFGSFSDQTREYGYDANQNKLNVSLITKKDERYMQVFIEVIAEYDHTVHLKVTSKDNIYEKSYKDTKKEDLFNDIVNHIKDIY